MPLLVSAADDRQVKLWRMNGNLLKYFQYFYSSVYVMVASLKCPTCNFKCNYKIVNHLSKIPFRAGARTLIGGGGGIFIYSGSARLVSFVIKLISKEISRA